jgi:hypothetical protein
MAQVCEHWEERGSVKSLVSTEVHSHGGSPASRRALVRLLGIAPAALLLSGLFTVWAGPFVTPVAAAAPTGVVAAWGVNDYGENNVPAGLSGVTAIAAGQYHSLALKSDGTVVAWGDDTDGQTTVPTGLSGVIAIAAGGWHSLALKSDGTVVAWGSDFEGETDVPAGLSGVTAIAAGGNHSLALKSNGTVVAWGDNGAGQTYVPAGLSGVTAIAAGAWHSLALKSNGTVVAWGDHSQGEATVPVGAQSGVLAIAAGELCSLALKSNGTVVAWGRKSDGEADVPAGLSGVIAIAAGGYHSLALKSDGTVVGWGARGQTYVPTGLSGVTAIAASGFHSLALVPTAVAAVVVSGMTTPRLADSTGSIRVTAVDAGGKRLPSYRGTIHFTSSDTDASLPTNYTFTAADVGTHVFVANVILRTAGTQWVRASDAVASSVTGAQDGIVVTPHVVTSIVAYGMRTPRPAASTGSIRVTALDGAGKRVYSYRGTVHFTSSDAAASLPPDYTFTAADNGTHVFVANVILETPGTWSVTATDTATASLTGTQTGVVVNATPLLVSGMTTPRTAGTIGSIRVTAVDASGNRNPSYLGTIHLTSSDSQADLPADYTFTAADAGTHVFTGVILKTAGTQSVTATDAFTAAITGIQSGIAVTPAKAKTLVVSGMTTPRTAGSTGSIRVTAIDAYGNRIYPGNGVASYLGTIEFTSTDPQASLPPDYTFTAADNGTHVFVANVILRSPGTWSVTATDTTTASLTGTQTGIVVH